MSVEVLGMVFLLYVGVGAVLYVAAAAILSLWKKKIYPVSNSIALVLCTIVAIWLTGGSLNAEYMVLNDGEVIH